MNKDRDKNEAVDSQLAAHYGSLADEVTPPQLDRAVLQHAGDAARADRRREPFGGWLRPVAFVATAALSLAIILELSDTGVIAPSAETSFEAPAPAVARPGREAPSDTATKPRTAAETAAALRREKSVTAIASKLRPPATDADAEADDTHTANAVTVATTECSDAQKSTVEEWWHCIDELRRAGENDKAEAELESLQEEFPDFVPPAATRDR